MALCNWIKGVSCDKKDYVTKLERGANSRLGKSVSDLYRAKIRLGEFKAVYSSM